MQGQDVLIGIVVCSGVLIILIGLYIQKTKAYHLIAGYNSLSQEEKKNLDIDKYARMFRNVFLLMGFLMIIAYPVLVYLNIEAYVSLLTIIIIILGAVYLNYKGQNYFKRNKDQQNT
jgi:phosphatidylglycerophosphate synthase